MKQEAQISSDAWRFDGSHTHRDKAFLPPTLANAVIGSWRSQAVMDGSTAFQERHVHHRPFRFTKHLQLCQWCVVDMAQSLKITQSGFGGSTIKLHNNGYVDDFLANNLLSFTFSVPSAAESGSTAGYSQLYNLTVNASSFGYNNVASGSTWLATPRQLATSEIIHQAGSRIIISMTEHLLNANRDV